MNPCICLLAVFLVVAGFWQLAADEHCCKCPGISVFGASLRVGWLAGWLWLGPNLCIAGGGAHLSPHRRPVSRDHGLGLSRPIILHGPCHDILNSDICC